MMPDTLTAFAESIEDLLQSCDLEIFVPLEASEQYLDDIFTSRTTNSNNDDILSHIQRRRLFLADELFDLHVVLRVPFDSKETVHRLLSQLTIHVGAHVEDGQERQRVDINTTYATRDISRRCIFSSEFNGKDKFGLLIAKGSSYIFWKENCHLSLPKDASEKVHVYFVTTATRATSNSSAYTGKEEEYLRNGTPLPSNILQPLFLDPALENVRPYMSALRFAKDTSPISEKSISRKPNTLTRSKLYPTLPILSTNFRVISCTRSRTKLIMLLSIEITASTLLNIEVRSVKVDLSFASGVVRQRTQSISTEQPLKLRSGDQTSLVYEITRNDIDSEIDDERPFTQICSGNIVALIDIPSECSTRVFLDCEEYIRGAFRKAASELLVDNSPYALIKPYNAHKDHQTNSSLFHPFRDQGIAISVSGPQEVRWGEVFVWDILIVNKTHAARRCRVTLLHDGMERFRGEREFETRPIKSRVHQEMNDRTLVQENILDLLLSQRKAMVKRTSILCLSPDIRIDPLVPWGCFATKLELLPLQLGRCSAGVLQITDEQSKEVGVIKAMPDIIVIEPNQN